MFTDSLIESSGHIHTRRGWTALFSLALQSVALAVAILVPMIITHAGPLQVLAAPGIPFAPVNAAPREERPKPQQNHPAQNEQTEATIVAPDVIPTTIDMTPEESKPRVGYCPGCSSTPIPSGPTIPGFVPSENIPKPPEPKPEEHKGPFHVSVVELGELKQQVRPTYPSICRQLHCQGQVVMHAIISRDGSVESLQIISSANPILGQAALEAVRRWRYRPYKLNGEAVEVETQITVNFTLGNN